MFLRTILAMLTALPCAGHAQTVMSVEQFGYDAVGHVQCTAVRMNPAVFGILPSNACTQGTAGTQGADRITENVYDAAGQLIQIQKGVGAFKADGVTPLLQAYATYAYSLNGKQTDVIDANGNHAQMVYDGFDRQIQWIFPSTTPASAFNGATQATALATANTPDVTDYEAYGYDANGNRTSLRKRDGSVLGYQYDALNRVAVKVVPQRSDLPATDTRSVYNSYDLQGHQLTAWFDSPTSGQGVTNTFDALGRQTSSSLTMDGATRLVSYCYDADGNRILVGYPDSTVGTCPTTGSPTGWTNYALYTYDGLDRPLQILRSGSFVLASYAYNADGMRHSFASNGGAVSTGYNYDAVDRLSGLTNAPANASYADSFTFAYNPASQITQQTKSNNTFVYAGAYNVSRPYTVNGLNQYTAAGTASFTYDMNGNLTGDGANTYLYDVENRLVGAGGQRNAALRFDPLGRLYEVASPTGTTRFVYGGDELLAEYDANGNLLRRYVHGADLKSDDPIAWYEGPAFTSSNERLLRPNWQGSIELVTDTAGQAVYAANTYDEYGIPGANNAGRFQYTGQAWIPELGMDYYKARMYSPTLGRFMQTDPIGYKDNINLYAYVANDPVDGTDFTGLAGCSSSMSSSDCDAAKAAQAQARKDIANTQSALRNLTDERAAVASGAQSELGAQAKSTESELNKAFGDSSSSTIKSVQSTLYKIDNVLSDDGSHYQFSRGNFGTDLGRASPIFGSTMKLGDAYFKLGANDRYRVITQIHEAGHIVGENLMMFEAYGGSARWAPTWYHLYNADDIAFFAYNVGNR